MDTLIILLILILSGYFFGRIAESRHYRSIEKREGEFMHLPTSSNKEVMGEGRGVEQCQLVTGNVVISVDYFKRLLAGLRNIFGGNVQSYETLVDRARREAVLRMKASCPDADQVINLRLETASIYKGQGEQIGSVEVLAYGTAVYFR